MESDPGNYQSTPKELREASAIDGANEIQHFFKILMPVCKPIIAVLALYSFDHRRTGPVFLCRNVEQLL